MPLFKTQSVRAWEKEWRESDWRETIPLASGRECPACLATICSGRSWRAHWARHVRDDERLDEMHAQIRVLSKAVRILAVQAGHADWYPAPDAAPEERDWPEDLDERLTRKTAFVLGQGDLPEEMRGGSE